jgi:hypothetical protein
MEIDSRTACAEDLKRTLVYINGVNTSAVYANDETGIVERYKLQAGPEGLVEIRHSEDRPVGVGESNFNGRITEFVYGFVTIVQTPLDSGK